MSVVEWLESPEGEKWSMDRHFWYSDNAVYKVLLVTVVDDDPMNQELNTVIWAA